jgi:hypothetical protein
MNHLLVAELLVEDAKLKDAAEALERARLEGDASVIRKAEAQWMKHNNLRNLILAEMDSSDVELYELQREHPQE